MTLIIMQIIFTLQCNCLKMIYDQGKGGNNVLTYPWLAS